MATTHELAANQAATRRLRDEIDATYPKGRFVAVAEQRVFADDPTLAGLLEKLRAAGKDPLDAVAVRAGERPPAFIQILRTRAQG